MLLANVTVAKKIYDSFPEVSILRNHPPPKQNIMERVEKVLHKYGFKLDGTSSKALQVSTVRKIFRNKEFLSTPKMTLP